MQCVVHIIPSYSADLARSHAADASQMWDICERGIYVWDIYVTYMGHTYVGYPGSSWLRLSEGVGEGLRNSFSLPEELLLGVTDGRLSTFL